MKANHSLDEDIAEQFKKEREDVYNKTTKSSNRIQIIISIIIVGVILASTFYQLYSYFWG